jgi:hypothetical protein
MGYKDRAKAEWLKVLRGEPANKMANMYLSLLQKESR